MKINELTREVTLTESEYMKLFFCKQLIDDAIEREVKIDANGYPYIGDDIELYDYDKDVPLAKKGDKAKIVVIKEAFDALIRQEDMPLCDDMNKEIQLWQDYYGGTDGVKKELIKQVARHFAKWQKNHLRPQTAVEVNVDHCLCDLDLGISAREDCEEIRKHIRAIREILIGKGQQSCEWIDLDQTAAF